MNSKVSNLFETVVDQYYKVVSDEFDVLEIFQYYSENRISMNLCLVPKKKKEGHGGLQITHTCIKSQFFTDEKHGHLLPYLGWRSFQIAFIFCICRPSATY